MESSGEELAGGVSAVAVGVLSMACGDGDSEESEAIFNAPGERSQVAGSRQLLGSPGLLDGLVWGGEGRKGY